MDRRDFLTGALGAVTVSVSPFAAIANAMSRGNPEFEAAWTSYTVAMMEYRFANGEESMDEAGVRYRDAEATLYYCQPTTMDQCSRMLRVILAGESELLEWPEEITGQHLEDPEHIALMAVLKHLEGDCGKVVRA